MEKRWPFSFALFLVLASHEWVAKALPILEEPRSVELSGLAESWGIARLESGAPGQFPAGRLSTEFLGELGDEARVVIEMNATVGGTVRKPTRPGILDLGRAFQREMPLLAFPRAYLEFSRKALDLRFGLQKFSWGRLDGNQPADLINPESYLDPLLEDEDTRKVGVPAVTVDLSPGGAGWPASLEALRLTLVWVVAHPSFRFPLEEERWYPPVGRPPRQAGALFWFLREHNASPPRGIGKGNVGVRIAGLSWGMEWALYFYDGFDPAANFAITNSVKDAAAMEMFVDLIPDYQRIRAFGADWGYAIGGATLRGEAVYFSRRGYPMAVRSVVEKFGRGGDDFLARFIRGDLVSVFPRRDAIEWGMGIDYELRGTWALVQFNQTVLFHNDAALLIENVDSSILGLARRSLYRDLLDLELRGLYFVESPSFMIAPSFRFWVSSAVELEVGAVLIGGGRRTLLGQFTHNDEAYIAARYHF